MASETLLKRAAVTMGIGGACYNGGMTTQAIAVNLNHTIRFRILPRGADAYVKHFRDFGAEPLPISTYFKTDAEGWSETQIWNFCAIFGPVMGMGFDPPVDTSVEIIPSA